MIVSQSIEIVSAIGIERIEVDSDDWPRCAQCHMPVESFYVLDDKQALAFVAVCHNQTQVVVVQDSTWASVIPETVNLTQAFEVPL